VAAEVAIRAATRHDMPAIRAIWAANGDAVPEGGADTLGPYLGHLLATGTVLLAEDGAEPIAFGAVVERGGIVHLADLFVRPDRQGGGLGNRLLTALYGQSERRTTFGSDDPRAVPLYVRHGMVPLWTQFYLDGVVDRLPVPDGIRCRPASIDDLVDLERAWTGLDRRVDHVFWASLIDARPLVALAGDRPVAIAHARTRRDRSGRWVSRAVLAPDADPASCIAALYHAAAEGGRIGSCLGGPNPALRPLLEAGFRIVDKDTFLASHDDLLDPIRRITDGGLT
jgi:GNAT superfamily N-acetyltransferase